MHLNRPKLRGRPRKPIAIQYDPRRFDGMSEEQMRDQLVREKESERSRRRRAKKRKNLEAMPGDVIE